MGLEVWMQGSAAPHYQSYRMCLSHVFPLQEQGQMTADVLGFSLRFPESDSPSSFWANLSNGVDMQTSDARRWPVGLFNLPPRTGKAPGLDLFDNTFFKVHGKQAQRMDPQQRKLLEVLCGSQVHTSHLK